MAQQSAACLGDLEIQPGEGAIKVHISNAARQRCETSCGLMVGSFQIKFSPWNPLSGAVVMDDVFRISLVVVKDGPNGLGAMSPPGASSVAHAVMPWRGLPAAAVPLCHPASKHLAQTHIQQGGSDTANQYISQTGKAPLLALHTDA